MSLKIEEKISKCIVVPIVLYEDCECKGDAGTRSPRQTWQRLETGKIKLKKINVRGAKYEVDAMHVIG